MRIVRALQVSTGQTTAELMKGTWKRDRNPFDQGARANCVALLAGAATPAVVMDMEGDNSADA